MDSDIRVLQLETELRTDNLRTPLKFGKVTVSSSTSLIVKATVENRLRNRADGLGSMSLGAQWAFPEHSIPYEKKLEAMIKIGRRFCRMLERRGGFAHPIDIFLGAKHDLLILAKRVSQEVGLSVPMPVLGTLVSASPVDAALHDAFGRVNGICSYDGYGPRHMAHDLSFYLGDGFHGRYISDYLRPRYAARLPVFHLVGGLDKLTRDEVDASDPRDGLPVALEDWIRRDGVFCFKVKLSGVDVDWDVQRTRAAAEIASETLREMGRSRFFISADANEMSPSPEATLEYLRRLKAASPLAFKSLLYLEQPTERDLAHHRLSMRRVARIRPVLADEGVTDLESLDLAIELGWLGVALKTCKAHSSALLFLAKAEQNGLPYSVQDLTCPGLALVHSATLAARSRPLKGFEYNARQYLPFAFKEVQEKHKEVFTVRDGKVHTGTLEPTGLGFRTAARS